ncbi:MAG: PorT family protein [Cyclobacteriaceae bacterium]
MKRLLPIVILSILTVGAYAQNCTQKLNQAEDEYEAGRLIGIPQLLEGCLDNFSQEEEVRARKLLTQVYIFTDQEAKAEVALVELLKTEPEHRLDPQVDPAEMFFLYNQYRTRPIFRVGIRVGVNSSSPRLINEYAVFNNEESKPFYNGKTLDGETSQSVALTDSTSATYVPRSGLGIGFNGEILIERHFGKGFELGLGPQFRFSQYHLDSYLLEQLGEEGTNRQMYLRAPLIARYTYGYENRDQKFLPYAFVGFSFDYLLSANYSQAARFGGTAYTLEANSSDKDLKAAEQVNSINYSLLGGLGVKIRAKTHFITIEARYDNSLRNYINGENRYLNKTSLFDLGFVESDLSLDFWSFTVGYTISIYSPKKLKEY